MSNIEWNMDSSDIQDLAKLVSENLLKSFATSTVIPTLQDQKDKGVELSQVFREYPMETEPFGVFYNPFAPQGSAEGFRRKPSMLSNHVLMTMARKCEPVAAIIKIRTNQVAAFARPADDSDKPGFRIKMRDKEAHPTDEDKKIIKILTDFMLNTGYHYNRDRVDNFEQYLRKITRDRLTIDATVTQLVANRDGLLSEFYAMDGSTVYFAVDTYKPTRNETYEPIMYIQEIDGVVVAEFTNVELAYGVANVSTDVRTMGYGESELELLIEIVTSYLFSRDYNKSFFTKGSVPAGILSLIGKYKEEELRAFKREWALQINGAMNQFRVPIVAAEEGRGIDFKLLKTSQKDAEFMKWMDFLIRMTAAIYQTSPEEINFSIENTGASSPVIAKEGGQAILASKDRGLVPLLRFFENYINSNIIYRIDPRYVFEFTGVEPEDEDKRLERENKAGGLYISVNEIRAKRDLKPFPKLEEIENYFDLPADATTRQIWMQLKQAKEQQEQAAAQGGQPGAEQGEQAPTAQPGEAQNANVEEQGIIEPEEVD
jgi:hypothetical protein